MLYRTRLLTIVLIIATTFFSCSKSDVQEVADLQSLKGTYTGTLMLTADGNCTKGEQGKKIHLKVTGDQKITLSNNDLDDFVFFPEISATLDALKNGVYYFTVVPFSTENYWIIPEIGKSFNGNASNIAIYSDGRMDFKIAYYTKGETRQQFLEYSSKRMHY